MQCERARELISAALDSELEGAEVERLEEHVASCPACAAAGREMRWVGKKLGALARLPVPPNLERRIRKTLDAEDANAEPAARTGWRHWLGADVGQLARWAAVLLAVAAISSLLTYTWTTREIGRVQVWRGVVDAHIRSLLQDSPVQVASSDTHAVKPWFAGRVDVSPVVRDLAAEGFPLVGGRLDYVNGRRVGVLVYKQRRHVINVFVAPAGSNGPAPAQAAVQKGYNLLTWSAGGVTYCAVSDISPSELQRLRDLL